MVSALVPAIAGIIGDLIMIFFLRRARFFHLPETQMIRAIGSMVTKKVENALWPGFLIHLAGGIFFAYFYRLFLETAPGVGENLTQGGQVMVFVVVCGMMGFVHGLIVTLFLVISVSQYHPIEEFRSLDPGDMAAHVIAHIVYGTTVGFLLSWLPKFFS